MKRILCIGLIVCCGAAGTVIGADSSHAGYLQRMRADIDGLTRSLQQLEHQGRRITQQRQADFQRQMHALWKKERLARVQLEHLGKASESQWKKLRAQEDSTVIRLRKSYRYVVNHYIRES